MVRRRGLTACRLATIGLVVIVPERQWAGLTLFGGL